MPFIMITSVSDMGQIMSVSEEHVDAYLVKPVTEAILRQKVFVALKRVLEPDAYQRALFKGMKYLRDGEFALALQILEEAKTLQPNQSATYFNLAQVMEKTGRLEEAEINYRQCSDFSNDLYVKSLDGLARIYQQKGDTDNALEVLKRAVEISPNTANRHMDLAMQFKAAGRTDEAKSAVSRALSLARKMNDLPPQYLEACMEFGMDKEAMELIQRGSIDELTDLVYLNRMGIYCRRCKALEQAKKYYKRALKLAPDDETLNYNFAVLLVDLDDLKTARQHLYHILERNPQSENAINLIVSLDKGEG